MGIKSFFIATIAIVLSTNINAALIDNGNYTTDDVSGLDWLDLTETVNMSFNNVSAQLGSGGAYEGWSYATMEQIGSLFESAGGNVALDGWQTENNGVVEPLLNVWGNIEATHPAFHGSIGSAFLYDSIPYAGAHAMGLTGDWVTNELSSTQDYFTFYQSNQDDTTASTEIGSALVRVNAVPVPAAVWLFGSGLIGLIGLARRKSV